MRVNVDFENAFNSVPHENLWTVLRAAFKIPDIDLLEAIYSVATVSLPQSQGVGRGDHFRYWSSAGFGPFVHLFNMFLNPLLLLLMEIGKRKGIRTLDSKYRRIQQFRIRR